MLTGLRLPVQTFRDLRHDGDRDFRGRDRADIEADRGVNAGNVRVVHALLLQSVNPAAMSFPRAERADVETIARQRVEERRIINLWIMRQRDKGGVPINT